MNKILSLLILLFNFHLIFSQETGVYQVNFEKTNIPFEFYKVEIKKDKYIKLFFKIGSVKREAAVLNSSILETDNGDVLKLIDAENIKIIEPRSGVEFSKIKKDFVLVFELKSNINFTSFSYYEFKMNNEYRYNWYLTNIKLNNEISINSQKSQIPEINNNTYTNLLVDKQWSKDKAFIEKIETNIERTLIYYKVKNPVKLDENMQYAWYHSHSFNFIIPSEKSKSFYIIDEDNKTEYKQIKHKNSKNLPSETKKEYFTPGTEQTYIIAFEPLKIGTKKISLKRYNEPDKYDFQNIYLLTENEKNEFLIAKKEKELKEIEDKNRKEQERLVKIAEKEKLEFERLAKIKKDIENKAFSGYHYYDYGNFKYTGNFINGIPNGQGKWEKSDGSWYEGEFKNGVENGIGTLRQKDGLRYTGNFLNGLPNGKFKIQRWTLMGLAKDEWDAVYENGKLVSSTQTETGMSDFLSGKNNNSISSVTSKSESLPSSNSLKTSKVVKFETEGEVSVMGTKTIKYFVKYEDGTTGYLYKYYQKDGGKWAVYDGLAKTWEYSTKEEAIQKLYEYKN